jgi:diguanylate cyclase (GGDEF)-like protein
MSKKTLVMISQDMALKSMVEGLLRDTFSVVVFNSIQSAIDFIYNTIPNLIVIDLTIYDSQLVNILNNLKGDPIFSQLPVMAILSDNPENSLWDSLLAEDYIRRSNVERDMYPRVHLAILRSERVVEINPLTRLPGNISINRQIQGRLDESRVFAIAYADLDNFKPFNDHYGFSRGDEMIRVTGRLILNIVKNRQSQEGFVGHIGGDDFIYVTDVELVEEISNEIIEAFDRIVPTFYDAEDRDKGYIKSVDRQGNIKAYPAITISIGITHNKMNKFTHYGEITEVASEMKRFAKTFKGSCFKIDQRQYIVDK